MKCGDVLALPRKLAALLAYIFAGALVDRQTRSDDTSTQGDWEPKFDPEVFTPKFYYEKLREEIEREDNITHQRLTWLMTFQGFLITAMTFLLTGQWPSAEEHSGILFLRRASIGAVGLVGLLLAMVSGAGINASRDAIERVVEEWRKINEQYKIVPYSVPRTFGEGEPFRWGSLFARLLPLIFVLMWTLYLLFYGAIVLGWLGAIDLQWISQ